MADQSVKEGKKERSPYSLLNKGEGLPSAENLTEGLTRPGSAVHTNPSSALQSGEQQSKSGIVPPSTNQNSSQSPSRLEGSETSVPLIREDSRDQNRQILSMPSLSSGFSLDREVLSPLQNIVKDLQTELKFEKDKLKGAISNRDSAIKDRTFGFQAKSALMWSMGSPYWLMHKTSKAFGWGVCQEPPTTLCAQNKEMIDECEAQIKYQGSKVKGIEEKISEVVEHMGALKNLNDTLMSNRDSRQFLSIRKEIQERQSAIITLVDEARRIDDPSKKEEWNKKRAELAKGLDAIDKQLQFTETTLRVTQKVCIISGTILATGGAASGALFAGAAATGAAATGAAASGTALTTTLATVGTTSSAGFGFTSSAAIGTLVGTGLSITQIGGESLGRLPTDQGQLSKDEVMTKLGSDTKDAFLYSLGSGISRIVAGGLKAIGGRVVMTKAAQSAINSGSATATVNAVQASSTLSHAYNLGKVVVGSVTSGITQSAVTESLPAMVDTVQSYRSGQLEGKHFWWEYWHRLGSAATGGAIGRGFSSARAGINSLASRISSSATTSGVTSVAVRGTQAASHVLLAGGEVFADANATLLMEDGKAGWIYGKDGELSASEREQLLISTLVGNVSGWHSEVSYRKGSEAHENTVRSAVEDVHNKANQVAAKAGLDSDLSVYVGRGDSKNLRVKASGEREKPLAVHLGRDPRVGSQTNAHRVTNEINARIDQRLGGRVKGEIDLIMNQVERIVPQVEGSPVLNNDRKRFLASLRKEAELRASGISDIGNNPRDLLYRAAEYNNSRHIRDRSVFKVGERISLLVSKYLTPYGFEQVLKVDPPDSNLTVNRVSDAVKSGMSGTAGTIFRTVLGNPVVNWVKETTYNASQTRVGQFVVDKGSTVGKTVGETYGRVKSFTYNVVSQIPYPRETFRYLGGYIPAVRDISNSVIAPAYGVLKSTLVIPPASAGPGGGILYIPDVPYLKISMPELHIPNSVGLILASGSIGYNLLSNTKTLAFGLAQRTPFYKVTPSTPREAAKMLAHIEEGKFYKSKIEKALNDPLVLDRDKVELRKQLQYIIWEINECRPLLDMAMKRYVPLIVNIRGKGEKRIIDKTSETGIRGLVQSGYENASRVRKETIISSASEQFKKTGLRDRTDLNEFTTQYLPLVVSNTSKIGGKARKELIADSMRIIDAEIDKVDKRISKTETEVARLERSLYYSDIEVGNNIDKGRGVTGSKKFRKDEPAKLMKAIDKKKAQLETLRETKTTQSTKKQMIESAREGKDWAGMRIDHPDSVPQKSKLNLGSLAKKYESSLERATMTQSMRRLARGDGTEGDSVLVDRYKDAFDAQVSRQKPEKRQDFIDAQQGLLNRSMIIRDVKDKASNSETIIEAIRLHDLNAGNPYDGIGKIKDLVKSAGVEKSNAWIDGLAPSRFTEIDLIYKEWRISGDPQRAILESQIIDAVSNKKKSIKKNSKDFSKAELDRFEAGINARKNFDESLKQALKSPSDAVVPMDKKQIKLREDLFKSIEEFAKEVSDSSVSGITTKVQDSSPFGRIGKSLKTWDQASKILSDIHDGSKPNEVYSELKQLEIKERSLKELVIKQIEDLDIKRHELDNSVMTRLDYSSFQLKDLADLQSKVRGKKVAEIETFVDELVRLFDPPKAGASKSQEAKYKERIEARVDQRAQRLIQSGGQEFPEMQKLLDLYGRRKIKDSKALSKQEDLLLDEALRIVDKMASPHSKESNSIRLQPGLHSDTIKTMDLLLATRSQDLSVLKPFGENIARWEAFLAEGKKRGLHDLDIKTVEDIIAISSNRNSREVELRIAEMKLLSRKYDNNPEAKTYFELILKEWDVITDLHHEQIIPRELFSKLLESIPVKSRKNEAIKELANFTSGISAETPLVREFLEKIKYLQEVAFKDMTVANEFSSKVEGASMTLNDGAESVLLSMATSIRKASAQLNGEADIDKQIEVLSAVLERVSLDTDIRAK